MITSMMRRALLSGDGSTLSLDFTTGVIDSRLTFARASGSGFPTGTGPSFIGSNGYVQYAGANVPRFDYNPSTLAARGLLIEAQATNVLTDSNDLTTGWTWTHIADLTANSSPDNSNNATLWEATSGNATIIRTAAVGTSAQRTFSFWAKRDTGSGNFQYTLDNGGTWTTLAITSSWVRYVIAATTANHQVGFRIQTHGDIVGIWGCQLETGSGASSYIPTGASTATRLADNCSIVSPNFSTWYNQGEGTFLLHCQLNRLGAQHLLNVNVNNAAPRLMITETSSQFNAAAENPSGTNFNLALGSSSTNAAKVIAAFKNLDVAGTRNGATVQTSTAMTVPTTVNLLRIGSAEGGYQYMTGTVSLLKYWPTRLPNAQLQSITT